MSDAPVLPGDLLAEKYLVDRVIGQGGMGVVVAARHVELDERVAIKFLLPDFATRPEVVTRFLREGKAAVKIRSEHVARVSDVGRLANGSPYMVMEYLDGCDLGELLRRRGPLPVQETALYVLQACEALAEAHAQGIVHRDLKPPNLFLTHRADGSPCVKVLDFGIAKFTADDAASSMTKTNGMMGSGVYMSPEQLRSSKDVDARTDIWGLGVIMFELLTGKAPFEAEEFGPLVAQILEMPATPLRTCRADAPAELEAVIARCLEKRRDQRFGSVAELAVAMLPFAGSIGTVSVDRISRILRVDRAAPTHLAPSTNPGLGDAPKIDAKARTAQQTDGPWGQTGPRELPIAPRRRTAIFVVGAAVSLLVAIGATAVVVGRGNEPTRASASTEPAKAATNDPSPVAKTPTEPSAVPSSAAVPAPSASAVAAAPTASPSATTAPLKPKPTATGTIKKVKPKANCDPPTYVGSDGLEHFKPECK